MDINLVLVMFIRDLQQTPGLKQPLYRRLAADPSASVQWICGYAPKAVHTKESTCNFVY